MQTTCGLDIMLTSPLNNSSGLTGRIQHSKNGYQEIQIGQDIQYVFGWNILSTISSLILTVQKSIIICVQVYYDYALSR
jgi:hypothetical protein